jgi:signal transduction histidine kinase
VLINLLDNAINASKEGGRLKVPPAEDGLRGKRQGSISRSSTMARGIPAELLPKILTYS